MNKLSQILELLEDVVKNPNKKVVEFKEKTGSKAIGCLPVYTPAEIIHAGGMLPVGIWGGNVEISKAKQYYPAFCCSIMQSCMELALNGAYDELAAVIIPGMCDTLNCMGQNWKGAIEHIEYIPLVHPQNRKLEAGVEYLVSEYANVKKQLEKISGKEITEADLEKSIDLYNEHRDEMERFINLAASHANTVNNYQRSLVLKSSYFMLKEEHLQYLKEINEILEGLPEEKYSGKTVLASGIILDSKDILDILEENNMRIVADDLAHESRQIRTRVPEGKDALTRLAKQWSNIEGCSLAYDPKKQRGKMIADKVKEDNIDGVIFAMMKFCDPEEYDYPIIKSDLDDSDITSILIEIDQENRSNEQIRTRIQTFAEMI